MPPVELRARPATGLIDATIALLCRRYWDYFLAALVPALPFLVVAVFVTSASLRWVEQLQQFASGIGVAIAACLVSAEYIGRPISLGEAIVRALRRAPGLVAVSLLAAFFTLCGFVVLIVGGFVVAAWLYAALPAYVLEDVTVSGAISRSKELARGLVPHVLGVAVPAGIAVVVGDYAVAFAIRSGWAAMDWHGSIPVRVATLLAMFAQLAIRPIVLVPHAIVYFDLRIRRDGFDLEAMTAALADPVVTPVAADRPVSPPAADPA